MARGGFEAAELALNKLLKMVLSGDDAKRAIIEGLRAKHILARGRPLIYPPEPRGPRGKPMALRDIGAPGKPPEPGDVQDIPSEFWKKLTQRDVASWDWEEGYFFNSSTQPVRSYSEVAFREKEINDLVKKHKSLLETASNAPPEARKERRRHPSWNDWVAAVVILSQENQITNGMTVTDLLDRVSARLQTWNLKPKEPSTVSPTASAILDRLASHPPIAPVEVG